ncbi:hypothetical protein [Roseimarinus sediminis]|uniref:hypothetical protein n=1 Tax=Roseimarinus sediminis TaxID=1610899 RepID=UPI003D231D1C
MDFEKTYNNTPEHKKLRFLDAIIKHNDQLKKEFLAFTGSTKQVIDGLGYSDFTRIVSDTLLLLQKQFEAVDTEDPDWENYHPPYSGYIPDYEAYQYASEQEFDAIADAFAAKALDKIIEQNPVELLAMFTGFYEATQNAEIEDDTGAFDDVNDYLLGLHANAVAKVVDKIKLSALFENEIGTAFQLFFQYCNEEYPGNPYFPAHFEPLLIAFADKTENPAKLLEIFTGAGIEQSTLPQLTLFLNKTSGNSEAWLQSALDFYKHSEPVARDLLKYYFETNQPAFIALARELFEENEPKWVDFLQEYVSPQLDKELFVRVYLKFVAKTLHIDDYLFVQQYLSKADVDQLLRDVQFYGSFKAKILEAEHRYDEIKQMIEGRVSQRDFADIIQPLIKVYPDFCFKHIKMNAISTLETERGRSHYEQIARWLKLAQEIPGFNSDVLLLIQQLYTHKPNLPALKDEMRKAGLVK